MQDYDYDITEEMKQLNNEKNTRKKSSENSERIEKEMFIFAMMLPVLFIFFSAPAMGAVVINEVYVNPIVSETGGEAIELYNNGEEIVDISGLVVNTKSSSTDAILPEGSFIMPGGYFLIADVGFNELKDNSSWPDADYEEAITFTNTDGGVLISLGSVTLDSVAWGDAASLPAEFIEGSTLAIPDEGVSIYRAVDGQDSDDNSADFIFGEPNFRSSAYKKILENEINVILNVIDMHSYIDNLGFIDDDLSEAGIQIVPVPGEKRLVRIYADVNDRNFSIDHFSADVDNQRFDFLLNNTINATHDRYLCELEMNYYDSPGDYIVSINLVNNNSMTSYHNMTFSYEGLRAIEIDATDFYCDIAQGKSCNFGHSDNSSNYATIRNLGNVDTNILVKPEAFLNGNTVYPYEHMEFSLSGISQKLSAEGSLSIEPIPYGKDSQIPIKFSFAAPEDLKAGNYEGRIRIVATE